MTPTEGVPVAWAVVDRHGVLLPNSNEAAEVACFRTKDEADEELADANQGEGAPPWEDSKPFAVVALAPTHPAAASAEREAVVTCVYCGHAYPTGSPTHGAQLLKDHIAICEKHPMREVIAERDELGALLAAVYRIDTTMTEASMVAAAALAERVEKALAVVDARALSARATKEV